MMATAKNMHELRNMLMKEMRKAMTVAQKKMEADMYEETGGFYTGGEPKMYERTGALGDTPRTTSVDINGDTLSFDAYLDQRHQYTTGSDPTMGQVLDLANYDIRFKTRGGANARPVVGKRGFWERAESKMEKTLNNTMKDFFD